MSFGEKSSEDVTRYKGIKKRVSSLSHLISHVTFATPLLSKYKWCSLVPVSYVWHWAVGAGQVGIIDEERLYHKVLSIP